LTSLPVRQLLPRERFSESPRSRPVLAVGLLVHLAKIRFGIKPVKLSEEEFSILDSGLWILDGVCMQSAIRNSKSAIPHVS
jgi:hypothetical protein